jgi:cyclopropane fatty-acyl-phospholipid synthase-like methyltransferase
MLKGGLCVFTVSLVLLTSGLACRDQDKDKREEPDYNSTYVPSADEVIEKMFELAKVTEKDLLFDLGCGDGRILYMAAKKYGCRGVGLDLNPVRIRDAMDQAEKYKVGTLVEIRHGDGLKPKDLKDATVVLLYMLPEFMDQWFPIAEKTLKPGTRIVAHDYGWTEAVNGWEPTAVAKVKSEYRDNHKLLLWIVPEKKKNSK